MVATAALVLSGCGRVDNAGTSASTTVGDKPATGTVSLWAPDGDAKALDDTMATFKEENPDLDLEVTLIPEPEYNTKLQAAIASGTGPDVAQTYTEAQAGFIKGGAFAAVPDGLVDEDSFFSGSWAAGESDGTAYTVPWYAYTYTLVYRKDLADSAGLSAPTTWDEMIPFEKGLMAAGAVKGLSASVNWDSYTGQDLAQLVWQAGGDLISDDESEWTLDTPEMIEAIEYNASYFTSGIADTAGPGFLDAQPYFVTGKAVSAMTGPWVIGQYDDVAGEDGWTAENVGTALVPAGSAGSIGAIAGGSLGVLADSDNQDAAWKVVRFLSESDTQIAQYESYGSLPAVQSAWDDPAIADQPLLDAYFEQLQSTRSYPQRTTWLQIATQMGTEMESVAKGQETAEEAAANLQAFADGVGTGE
jgi:multiple sugar transport system substrate-binding protein